MLLLLACADPPAGEDSAGVEVPVAGCDAAVWFRSDDADGWGWEAVARVGPENDELGESSLSVVAGDVGADGAGDLVLADPSWPRAHGSDTRRGAVYVFHGAPRGVLDVRAADARVYGDVEQGYFTAVDVLDDGRVLARGYASPAERDASPVTWLLEGLGP